MNKRLFKRYLQNDTAIIQASASYRRLPRETGVRKRRSPDPCSESSSAATPQKKRKTLFVVDLDADTTEEEDEDVDDLDWSEEA